MSEGISAKRITGDDLRRWWRGVGYPVGKDTPDFVATLLAQINADATLATRLAEAERRAMAAEASYAGAEDDYRKVSVELARLRPLAAEAEAWEMILNHALLDGEKVVVYHRTYGLRAYAKTGRDTIQQLTAPTAVALLERLDALADARKSKPETWRTGEHNLDGNLDLGALRFPSAGACRKWITDSGFTALRPYRETVDPTTGVVTLTPEGV